MDSEETIQCSFSGNNSDAPVYLFQRSNRQDKEDTRLWDQEINEITSIIDVSIENATRLEQDSDMHRVYMDIPQRARECRAAAQSAIHACARFAEEHRLIVKGWDALMNNMDASIARLTKRATRFLHQAEKVQQQKPKAAALLQGFDEVIDELKRIRLPGALLAHSRGNADRSFYSDMSLYTWISAFDQEHSLTELVEQVAGQFKNFEQTDANVTVQNIEKVTEWSKNLNNREIKGINKRLSYLDHHLRQAEGRGKAIEKHTSKILETPPRIDQSSLEELLTEYRYLMGQIYTELKEIRIICNRFFQSKLELLRILRARLNTWIARTYNRLHHTHNEVLVFEEKFTGLKQRLDLIRQIREAPVMYATAVTEVIRRKTFQKEFKLWHSLHVEKCSSLSEEESEIRAQFSAKFEKHFLRVLFHGMFDVLPPFFVKNVPEFDTSLGPIDAEHLRELRKNIEELKQYLNVAAPQVFFRLSVRDPSAPSPVVVQSALRREESFITADPAYAMPTLSRNFPSTNWLSTDDVIDSSPSTAPALLMAKSPPSRVGSSSSLNMPITPSLNQLSMLGEEDELPFTSASTSVAKTAPIQIPTPQPRQMSEKSSQFSTPDDHFQNPDPSEERQFVVDDLTSRSQSYEFLKPVALQISSLSKDMLELRADVTVDCNFFKEKFARLEELTSFALEEQIAKMRQLYEDKLAEAEKERQRMAEELKKRDEEIEVLKIHREKCDASSQELAEKAAEVERLQSQVEALETRVKEVRSETYKEGIIAMELEKTRVSNEYEEVIEGKDATIRKLTKELEKKTAEVAHLQSDPEGEAFRKAVIADIRAELEKESKNRLELLTKGISQKKEEDISRVRMELEYEKKLFEKELKFSMKWLAAERDRLKDYVIEKVEDGNAVCAGVESDIKAAIVSEEGASKSVYCSNSATQTDFPALATAFEGMNMSRYDDMRESVFAFEQVADVDPESAVVRAEEPGNDNKLIGVSVQTRIGMKAMDRMVAVEDIIEGSTVLVIWNDRHNAYMLFSTSAYSHFVKESSVRRLGLATTLPNIPRRNWIMGKVSHLDLCVIRKADNRYRLPVETRVYRVDVEPLDVRSARAPTM